MGDSVPTQKELSDYFFNHCSAEITEKIEMWFMLHGKSHEASLMLYELWKDIDGTSVSDNSEETRKAFEKFKDRLVSSDKSKGKPSVLKSASVRWVYRLAACLLIPLAIFSLWQSKRYYDINHIEWIEKKVDFGGTGFLVLSDGTSVWMNSGSSIIYPEKFSGPKRQVFFSGEGHFDVAKNKRSGFEIKTGESLVRVVGTEFNLKAYPEDNDLQLSLLEGKVEFIPDTGSENCFEILPGDVIDYDRDFRSVSRSKFDVSTFSSWKDGKLYFKNTPLSDIVRQLERNFDANIVIVTDSLKSLRYHMAFVNDEPLEEILDVIDSDPRIRIETKGNVIEMY